MQCHKCTGWPHVICIDFTSTAYNRLIKSDDRWVMDTGNINFEDMLSNIISLPTGLREILSTALKEIRSKTHSQRKISGGRQLHLGYIVTHHHTNINDVRFPRQAFVS